MESLSFVQRKIKNNKTTLGIDTKIYLLLISSWDE